MYLPQPIILTLVARLLKSYQNLVKYIFGPLKLNWVSILYELELPIFAKFILMKKTVFFLHFCGNHSSLRFARSNPTNCNNSIVQSESYTRDNGLFIFNTLLSSNILNVMSLLFYNILVFIYGWVLTVRLILLFGR